MSDDDWGFQTSRPFFFSGAVATEGVLGLTREHALSEVSASVRRAIFLVSSAV